MGDGVGGIIKRGGVAVSLKARPASSGGALGTGRRGGGILGSGQACHTEMMVGSRGGLRLEEAGGRGRAASRGWGLPGG